MLQLQQMQQIERNAAANEKKKLLQREKNVANTRNKKKHCSK